MEITFKKFGKYQGKWVALDVANESVLAAGTDVVQVTKKLKKWNKDKVRFKYIVPFNLSLAPSIR